LPYFKYPKGGQKLLGLFQNIICLGVMNVAESLKQQGFNVIYSSVDRWVVFRTNVSSRRFRIFVEVVRNKGERPAIEKANQLLAIKDMEQDVDYQKMYDEVARSVQKLVDGHCDRCTKHYTDNFNPEIQDYQDYASELDALLNTEFCVSTRHLFPKDMPIQYGSDYADAVELARLQCEKVTNALIAFEYWSDETLNIHVHSDGILSPAGEFIVNAMEQP
jgi:hypothetical protein